jgi:hypothetical protein
LHHRPVTPLPLPSKVPFSYVAATPSNRFSKDPINAVKCSFIFGSLDEENGVQTTVVLWVVGDLCIATPNDLSSSGYETEFRDVYFDDGTLG